MKKYVPKLRNTIKGALKRKDSRKEKPDVRFHLGRYNGDKVSFLVNSYNRGQQHLKKFGIYLVGTDSRANISRKKQDIGFGFVVVELLACALYC